MVVKVVKLLSSPGSCAWQMNSEAKQTKMSEFGAEKGLLQTAKQGEQAAHAQKTWIPQ